MKTNSYFDIGANLTHESFDKDLIKVIEEAKHCLLYTSPSPRDLSTSRMPSSA